MEEVTFTDVLVVRFPVPGWEMHPARTRAHKSIGDEMRNVLAGIARSSPLFECHNPQKEFDMNIPVKNRLFETSDLF